MNESKQETWNVMLQKHKLEALHCSLFLLPTMLEVHTANLNGVAAALNYYIVHVLLILLIRLYERGAPDMAWARVMRRWNWCCVSRPVNRLALARWALPGGIPANAVVMDCLFSNLFTIESYFWQTLGSWLTSFSFVAISSQNCLVLAFTSAPKKQSMR